MDLSFVIPVYNEEHSLPELFARMCDLLNKTPLSAEVLLIDDGSSDQSYPMMAEARRTDTRYKIVQLSRNFGHQIAITAGMDLAAGRAVIIMDADLQDPPEVVLEMIEKWQQGFDIVYGIRLSREKETWFKKTSAAVFYRLIQKLANIDIPADVGDFRLVDRKAIEVMRTIRENGRFIRGLFAWMGFRQCGIRYHRQGRFAGETKYPLRKMIKLALDAVVSFSNFPLRVAMSLGFLVSFFSFIAGFFVLLAKLTGGYSVSGWTSLIVAFFFLGGLQLFVTGIVGEYLGRIFEEVKQRPLYIVREMQGVANPPMGASPGCRTCLPPG